MNDAHLLERYKGAVGGSGKNKENESALVAEKGKIRYIVRMVELGTRLTCKDMMRTEKG